ncbi:MAG: hypothetical protein JO202_18045 [Ktedonobacteraceae bacterium]|nr:hypothetical protein [Ktedonobacteraceae bacterium]
MLATAVVTGMRRGELLALRWSEIDFARGRLVVLHSVAFIAGCGYVEDKPKAAAIICLLLSLVFLLTRGWWLVV